MYFASREAAGKLLADQLKSKYRYENCTVVAMSDGGVMVGAQIAAYLHCVLTMLLFEEIKLPGELEAIGGVSQSGVFTYDSLMSPGEVDEVAGEFHNYLDEERMNKLSQMNRLIKGEGVIKTELLYGHNVILVADGLINGLSLDVAAQFLKPVRIDKLIIATPIATVEAVDRMHVLADEICCLSVQEDLADLGVDHYYDKQKVTDHETVIKTIENVVLNWK